MGSPPTVARPPSIALTVVITLLFGVFGAIPAATGSSKARALGQDGSKYWIAFALLMLLYLVFLFAIA